jgi:hypothetical protein
VLRFDSDGLEVKANPLDRLVLGTEIQIRVSGVDGILRVMGAGSAARGDLDDASVVDVAAALRPQVRMTALNGVYVNGNIGAVGKQNFTKSSGNPTTAPKTSKALRNRQLSPQ